MSKNNHDTQNTIHKNQNNNQTKKFNAHKQFQEIGQYEQVITPITSQYNDEFKIEDEFDQRDKMKNNSRPVSFASSKFICVNTSSNNVKINSTYHQNFTIKEQDNFVNMFATFATSYDTQYQVPYFQQVTQQTKQKANFNNVEKDQAQVGSYKSNFLFDMSDNYQQEQQYFNKKSQKTTTIKQVSSQSNLKLEKPSLAVQVQQKSPSFYKGKTMQSQGVLKISKNKFQHVTFRITQVCFLIQEVPVQIKSISKIKIYPTDQLQFKYNVLKINTKGMGQQLYLGLRKNGRYGQFSLPYYTFAKIIIKKLKYFGIHNITDWSGPERLPHLHTVMKKVKLVNKKQDKNANVSDYSNNQKTSKSVSERSLSIDNKCKSKCSPQQSKKYGSIMGKAITFIHGTIYKKSRHWGQWQKRYIQINEAGIFSYRHQQDQNASIKIDRKSIKYIWTWFSILIEQKINKKGNKQKFQQLQQIKAVQYEQRVVLKRILEQQGPETIKYLIIKVKHGFNDQSQFAIPICNYDSDSNNKNWLFAFFRILPNFQNKI